MFFFGGGGTRNAQNESALSFFSSQYLSAREYFLFLSPLNPKCDCVPKQEKASGDEFASNGGGETATMVLLI